MGNRANFVIVKDGDWQLYYSHWGGCRMLDALIGGPQLALRYAASLRRCKKDEWCDPMWADGGAVVDLDRCRVLFFGEPLMMEMSERRALMSVLATVWPGYEIGWAYDGTEELADYVGVQLRPVDWDRQPTLKLARGRKHLCHLISVVDGDGKLRFWPLWWHLSKAWHGPALLDKLPGPGISRIRLGKIPEGGAHIDVQRKTLGAWQTADTMGFFRALPELWAGWRTEVWEDRYEEQVSRCGGALRLPEVDPIAGIDTAETWLRERVFESFEDSPAGHIAQLAGSLAPLAPGFVVSSDALDDCGVRPTASEWARFREACNQVRCADAQSA
ncbi:hypothetical protein [Mycolicibacterium arseniciresistens]|uniref:Uncharacterized protein n=1 Tax=Mycolicibacterium arseniciresistens TaxID=3062257 RepID=A0ABT8UDY0_9MYCO|nr:hypothetical protein [Mycolicibacterium arseniciresistens]MDO3634409.1 hypothetical protein [Mycolicibacterium arseniciresistens]